MPFITEIKKNGLTQSSNLSIILVMIFTNIIFQQSLYPAQNFFADFGCLLTLPAMGSVVQAISHSTQNVHKEHTANTQQQQCALSHTDTHTLSHTHTQTLTYTHTHTHTHRRSGV